MVLFFILGIILQTQTDIAVWFLPVSTVAVVVLFLSFLPKINRIYDFRYLFGLGLALLTIVSGAFLTQQAWEKSDWSPGLETDFYKGCVMEEPVRKPKTYRCKVRITSAEKTVYIYLPIDSLSEQLVAGDYLVFYADFQSPLPYLRKQSISATAFVRQSDWQLEKEQKTSFSVLLQALSVRRMLLKHLQIIVPDPDAYSLAAALMFGYRDSIDEDLRQAFNRIGAAHILAISGTHFSILFGMLYGLLSFIGNSRRGKFFKHLLLLPLIWGFAFLTGFSPSVIRAALMMSIWIAGDLFSYHSFSLNTVAVAAFFMLLFNPLYLFDAGFQLSFSAVIAIILFYLPLAKIYESRNPLIKYLWELIAVSIAAQTGVLPLTLYYFRRFPVLFLITNLLLIPLTTILLLLIPFSLLLYFIFGEWTIMMWPLNQTLELFIGIVRELDRIG
ncbi:hypothetical protein AGMMS50262_05650 [Bacteroidia bacterium]|nr:hypothetical protein AGMMS50262_05650 [Bacteroidia bacterium]